MNLKLNRVSLNVKAALLTLAAVALEPLNRHYEQAHCLHDVEPGEMKKLETTVTELFNGLKSKLDAVGETAEKALKENSTNNAIHAKTADELKAAIAEAGKLQTELKANHDKLTARQLELEQKLITTVKTVAENEKPKTIGELVAKSEQFAEMMKYKHRSSQPIAIERKNIYNSTTYDGNQPLVAPDRRPGIVYPVNRRLTIRDLLPQLTTNSDVVQYAQETAFTNNAGPQGGLTSPTVTGGEGEIKPQSDLAFSLTSVQVITLAHFMAASRQVLDDSDQLAGYINSRLLYGLKLEEELELLTGTGANGKLNGINNQAAAFSYGSSGLQQLDVLLLMIQQVAMQNMQATGFVLHPVDWYKIMQIKDSQNRYLFSNPHDAELPQVWGVNVIPTLSQTQGNATCGAFDMGAAIYDRTSVNVSISTEHADFFTRNLCAILCEERLALVVYRGAAFVYGSIASGAGF